MIYQVASRSSVGHRTRGECERESSGFMEDCGRGHLGCLECHLMTGGMLQVTSTYGMTEQAYGAAKNKDAYAS
ncbi:hypothetical protein GBF38_010116 [Nibea albiflora]|uniref:Uncharacterized protein n=1 Tax=Nibea albiflora TaxID=240163 RepID=A0ACB7F958_NIBAL|nr:hypothetical protein GBF38_010116 [Nibea albiflora]